MKHSSCDHTDATMRSRFTEMNSRWRQFYSQRTDWSGRHDFSLFPAFVSIRSVRRHFHLPLHLLLPEQKQLISHVSDMLSVSISLELFIQEGKNHLQREEKLLLIVFLNAIYFF